MAYTPWDTYVDTVPVPTTIEELQQALTLKYNTTWPEIANQITSLGGDPTNFDELADLCGLGSIKSADGTSTMWYYKDKLDDFSYTPVSSISTNTYTSRSSVQTPMNTSIDDVTGKVTVSNTPKAGQFVQGAAYVMGEVGQATTAASVGIWLGKTIDSVLYNANPDFWDSVGMSSLNPETWASITHGDDSLGATLFNWVFGIDPNTGNVQGYVDADALAYMSYWMKTQDVFSENSTADVPESFTYTGANPMPVVKSFSYIDRDQRYLYEVYFNNGAIIGRGINYINQYEPYYIIYSDIGGRIEPIYTQKVTDLITGEINYYTNWTTLNDSFTYDGKTVYYGPFQGFTISRYHSIDLADTAYIINTVNTPPPSEEAKYVAWTLLYGEKHNTIEGIGTQTGATLPDTSTWSDIPSTDAYLRSAYPDSYSDAIQYDVMQPDGNVLTKTYVPVPMPENITSPNTQYANNPWNNPQPTSDNANQTTTEIDPSTSPDEFIKQLIKTITQTVQTTDTINPPTTGTGDSPTPVPITGSASALWSVYHPSQAQVNSFGAWLWTDNIITQIQQVLQNPMDGIITLHKVFAMPVDSGTGTIVIGRLDSQVGTALVTQQYVTVDCGYIDCAEEFGNVFDYEPYTSLHLYLPFIGIVPLNVNEVMRSTLHVVYGVDVFTGACLATVEVARDGNAVNLYQYSGIASVEYPLTGATHSGLLAGLAGIVGTIAMGAVTGGVGLVGAGAIANGAIQAATSKNAHASNFSGNAGAMGIKKPYLIIERPIIKVADTFPRLDGYPTNYSVRLGDCSNHVVCKTAHVHGINATKPELEQIENYLLSGVEI